MEFEDSPGWGTSLKLETTTLRGSGLYRGSVPGPSDVRKIC